MNGKTAVSAEVCPSCGSLDVRAIEPRWFQVDVDRRAEFDAELEKGWAEHIDFACRDCGLSWS